jgi:hypothetical protein
VYTCFATKADGRVANAGSFIRLGKKTDGETTFLKALRGKYVSSQEQYQRVLFEESGKEVEMIGFDKVEQLQSYPPPQNKIPFSTTDGPSSFPFSRFLS